MPELRYDPLTGHRVLISQARAQRPRAMSADPREGGASGCPFCEGNEAETPGEVDAIRRDGSTPDSPGWQVRVVPNKYPALATIAGPNEFDMNQQCAPAVGAHEVIVESPRHVDSWTALSAAEVDDILAIYQSRLKFWRENSDLKYAIIFKNLGAEAGASQFHAHSQLVALPLIPDLVVREHAAAAREQQRIGQCVYCRTLEYEKASGERIAAESNDFVAYCPAVSRLPFQLRVMPRQHASSFEKLDSQGRKQLGDLILGLLTKLEMVLPIRSYNLWLQTLPLSSLDANHFHWHIEILPRQSNIAGFEWGTGYTINAMPPEHAAEKLRKVVG